MHDPVELDRLCEYLSLDDRQCRGTTKKSGRCRNRISDPTSIFDAILRDPSTVRTLDSAGVEALLDRLAKPLLCKRWHAKEPTQIEKVRKDLAAGFDSLQPSISDESMVTDVESHRGGADLVPSAGNGLQRPTFHNVAVRRMLLNRAAHLNRQKKAAARGPR